MNLPPEIQTIISLLRQQGYEAYAVGGCVRDLILGRVPKDWDVTTSAKPEEIQAVFPKNFYANKFGTVTVLTGAADQSLKEVEITTFRLDSIYSDHRHPDKISFTTKIEEDLARRDFTVNAIALDQDKIIDPFNGQADIAAKVLRTVGRSSERFQEDALRLMRAIRLAAQLGFTIEQATLASIKTNAELIKKISQERIRDELVKIVMSDAPGAGINMLKDTGLLAIVLPELAEGIGVEQNKHHIYSVYDHSVKSLQFAAKYGYPLHIRLAALLHDIGKPRTRRRQGNDYTFYAHEIVGARMTEKLMRRLKFPTAMTAKVSHLVRQHMFYYDIGKITEAGIRRLLRRVGPDNFNDLIKLRIAERKGSGVPKAEPYRLRHLQFMAEKVSQQPITVGQLAINGNDLINVLKLKPSPIIGGILNALLAEVLDDPTKNKKEYLLEQAKKFSQKDPAELKKLGAAAIESEEKKREEDIKRKFRV